MKLYWQGQQRQNGGNGIEAGEMKQKGNLELRASLDQPHGGRSSLLSVDVSEPATPRAVLLMAPLVRMPHEGNDKRLCVNQFSSL